MSMIYAAITPFTKETASSSLDVKGDDVKGEICILVWEGIGNLVPKWRKCTARISGGYFYVENAKKEIVRWVRLDDDIELHYVPEKWAFGRQHTIALMPERTPMKRAAENADVLMFTLADAPSATRWMQRIQAAQKEILQLTEPEKQGTSRFLCRSRMVFLDVLASEIEEIKPSDSLTGRVASLN